MDRKSFDQADALLDAALSMDSDFAPALVTRAFWHVLNVGQGWATVAQASMTQAREFAEQALRVDASDARALTIAGHVLCFLEHRLDAGMALHDRALSENPNLAMAWALSGIGLAYAGKLDEALSRVTRYRLLSPNDPHASVFDTTFVIVNLLQRRFEAAAAIGRMVTAVNPRFVAGLRAQIATLGHMQQRDQAAPLVERLLAIEPGFTVEGFLATQPYVNEEHRAIFAEGLILAGVPGSKLDHLKRDPTQNSVYIPIGQTSLRFT